MTRGRGVNEILSDTSYSISRDDAIKYVRECINDNLIQVSPMCLMLGVAHEEVKLIIGRGLWKRLCKANYLQVKNLFTHSVPHREMKETDKWKGYVQTALDLFLDYPSEFILSFRISLVMSNGIYIYSDISKEIIKYIYEDGSDNRAYMDMYFDCLSISDVLDVEYNKSWSLKRMVARHKELTKLMRDADIGVAESEVFHISTYCDKIISKIKFPEGIEVSTLSNIKDYQREGDMMNHCILLYCKRSFLGSYVTFHISYTPERGKVKHSTLGVRKTVVKDISGLDVSVGHGRFIQQQHYGKNNTKVTSNEILSSAKLIISALDNGKGKLPE